MRVAMSYRTRRELLIQIKPRYREAENKQKKSILDEFVASTGSSRKYAIRLLCSKNHFLSKEIKRPRAKYYGTEDQEVIKLAWSATNYIAAKRLAPFLKEIVPALERHGHIKLEDESRNRITSISAATIDRILHSYRKKQQGRGISTTKSGKLLKKQIPVRTFADWKDESPGFFEADLVAHCGTSASGSFLYSLVLTDVATGWVECLPLLSRHQGGVIQALKNAIKLIPFPMLGLDTDNGSAFINRELIAFCELEKITFTRGRAYKKNDQCFVEQKNGVVVRQLVGYGRYEGIPAYKQLNELYRATRLYVNFFQPSMKLEQKSRDGATVHRIYDTAQTPLRRLLDKEVLASEKNKRLMEIVTSLDPILLLEQIKRIQDALWQYAVQDITETDTSKDPVSFDVKMCTPCAMQVSSIATDTHVMNDFHEREKRRYNKTKKARVPHTWRTRENPFEQVWPEICKFLEVRPERTAKSIFTELQLRYPGRYKKGQLRTLQRHVKAWRAEALLTFDYAWINDEILVDEKFITKFHGKITGEATF